MNAVFTITLYTTVAQFPHHYLAPYLTGSSLAQVFNAVLQILSLATGLSTLNSALVYFSMGLIVIGFTLILLIFATGTNQFYLYYMKNYHAEAEEKRVSLSEAKKILKKIWPCIVMMGLFILQSNASPTALIVSENEGAGDWNDIYFIPVATFFFGAMGDLIGRWISFKFNPNWNSWIWTAISLIRTVAFIFLTIFSNAQPRHHLPVLLPHDYQHIIITAVGSISGGYLVNLSSYNIARLVDPDELKDAYHVLFIVIGVQMGVFAFLSVIIVDLL